MLPLKLTFLKLMQTDPSPGMDFQDHTLGLPQAPKGTHKAALHISGQTDIQVPSTCSLGLEGAQDQRQWRPFQAEGNGEVSWGVRVPPGLGPISALLGML